MSTKYHQEVWLDAALKAETDIMRSTATPKGGRKNGETIESYLQRTREIQQAALARFLTAKAELESVGGEYPDGSVSGLV